MAPKPPSKGGFTGKARKSATAGPPSKKSKVQRPPAKQLKTKPGAQISSKPRRKARVYTDKELNLPALNMITPAGVQKPRGKKKGKIFVDDKESMMTILAMVNAEKEGQIESKMMKARQLEEIREARRKEAESREEKRREKLEDVKKGLRKGKAGKSTERNAEESSSRRGGAADADGKKKTKKRVSFA